MCAMRGCRVITVFDGDHFEVQLYQYRPQNRETIGKPTVLVDRKNGLIISLTPEANKCYGIKRLQNLDQAKSKCGTLNVIYQDISCDKPDENIVLSASFALRSSVLEFCRENIQKFPNLELGRDIQIEKNGSDEYFINMTNIVNELLKDGEGFNFQPDTRFQQRTMCLTSECKDYTDEDFLKRMENLKKSPGGVNKTEYRLAVGALLLSEICNKIKRRTEIVCSGGVATNMPMAKLACKLNKPNAITTLMRYGFDRISSVTQFDYLQGFGSDLGQRIKQNFDPNPSIKELQDLFEDEYDDLVDMIGEEYADRTGAIVSGRCYKNVQHKLFNKNVSSKKKRLKISSTGTFNTELNKLCQSILAKLYTEAVYNKRVPNRIIFKYVYIKKRRSGSKSFKLKSFEELLNTLESSQHPQIHQKDLMDSVIKLACTGNSGFQLHMEFIKEIHFRAVDFRSFEEIV